MNQPDSLSESQNISGGTVMPAKDKNRFSNLLKHLMTITKLKNYALAKHLQYDESYISKWISGALLPTEKNSEKIIRDISRCMISSLDEESREQLYTEYQVDQDQDLEEAIFDNLMAEFIYVINLKSSTGSEIAAKTVFYPELTLAQFLSKMRHPVLRQVKSLDVMMATDILSLDRHYQLSLSELENSNNANVTQRSYPGVRFSMMINLDVPDTNNTYNVQFIQNLLTNLSNVDFQLYVCPQSQGKILFTVKGAYSISGMIMDENHCLSVTATEEPQHANALYDRLQSLCSQESLAVRRTTMSQMIHTNEYMQYAFSRHQRWELAHVTEHFLPDEVFDQLAEEYCQNYQDAKIDQIKQVQATTKKILENMEIKLLLDEDGLQDFAITGMVDFYGRKMRLTPEQRLKCLEYARGIQDANPLLDVRILHSKKVAYQYRIASPVLFLSDSYCYMRIARSGPEYNLSVLNHATMGVMFRKYFDDLWDNQDPVDFNYKTASDMLNYLITMVNVQILTST